MALLVHLSWRYVLLVAACCCPALLRAFSNYKLLQIYNVDKLCNFCIAGTSSFAHCVIEANPIHKFYPQRFGGKTWGLPGDRTTQRFLRLGMKNEWERSLYDSFACSRSPVTSHWECKLSAKSEMSRLWLWWVSELGSLAALGLTVMLHAYCSAMSVTRRRRRSKQRVDGCDCQWQQLTVVLVMCDRCYLHAELPAATWTRGPGDPSSTPG